MTITPVSSEGYPVKRKPSAPKKFSYQLVQLEERSKLEDSGDIKAKQSPLANQPANRHGTGTQRRESEPAVTLVTVEGERKISAPAGPVHSVQPPSRAAATSSSVHRETDRDSLSRLADRPLPKVPEREQQQEHLQKQESQEDTDDDMEEVDENLYYVTTSSLAGKSEKEGPPPLSVAIPGQVPAGRVVWHEYVEIDEEEIGKMGRAMPPLPGQLLRLMPLLRSDAGGMTAVEPSWRMTTMNNDLSDDLEECPIDRSDSLESCPYIEPPQIGSPPVVPDRPDNLDDLIKRKAVASGEYSYAAVPGQNFGVRWMRFHTSNPHHISLAPVSSKDENQAFILAQEPAGFADKDGASGRKQKSADGSQPKSGQRRKEEGFYPPLLPPKTASLLREQRENPAPQSYLIPVLTKKKKRGGGQTNIDKAKSNSTSQLSPSVSRDAATGERMETTHKGEAAKKKRVPPLKPKPYKDSKTAKQQAEAGNPEGLKVMLVEENYGVRDPEKAEGRSKSSQGLRITQKSRRMDLSPSDVIGGRLLREKSPSLGNILETSLSSDFDSRERWIDKENKPTAKKAQKSGKVEKKMMSPGPQTIEKHEEEAGSHLRKQSVTHRPLRSDAVRRRPKTPRESPGAESDSQDQAKDVESPSLAVIRRNRETIVKHLSRALDMENLDLDFEQGAAATSPVSDKQVTGGKGSQSESSRGLGEILSELDSLLKNKVFSTEDLLQAIQSRLNIKVNIQGESNESDRGKPLSTQDEASPKHGDQGVIENSPASSQEVHESGKQSNCETKTKEEGLSEGDVSRPASEEANKPARAERNTAFYVNDEVLLNMKGLKMVTYTPEYMNTKYIPGDQSDVSAPNSQSSDQSSSSNDPTSYDDVQQWLDSVNKTESSKSDSDTKTQVKSKSPTTKKSPKSSTRTDSALMQESASSMKEKSKRKVPLQPPIRMRSQSTIDVSPKSRRKKLSNPPPEASEMDSPTRGYQLALRMEDERLFSTAGAHRRTNTVTAKDSSAYNTSKSSGQATTSSSRLSSSTGQSSSSGRQRPASGHRLSSDKAPSDSVPRQSDASNDAAGGIVSPLQQSPDHLSVPAGPMSSEQRSASVTSLVTHPHADLEQLRASQKLRHHYQNLFNTDDSGSPPVGLLESANIRDSRSFSTGSRPLQRVSTERRSTSVDTSVLAAVGAGGGNVFTNGVGVFTHRGGVLMNAGSGVVIELPEDAIPRGKKQKLWFEVKQDVINPLHDEGHDSSHTLTDSFQFNMGSAEFENYLAGKRERKVQLSPMILIGPSDAVLSRPIKIKMPHCLPYRNNSWHLHMFARAQDSETGDWTELSNTIGLVDLPRRRARSKVYEKSSYQMHIDYTQVKM